MDWETLYCPNHHCRWYGQPFRRGYLVKNGSSRGRPRAWCKACGGSVVLRYGTAYYGLDADPAIFETAVRALAEGNSLRATARIILADKDTICAWLDRAAQHCRVVMLYLWHDLLVRECQLDELWSFVHTKEEHLPGAKIYGETYGDAWVWIAFAPVWRLVLAFVIGKRDQAGADLLLSRVAHVTDEHIPLFTSDQLPEYRQALLNTYGEWYQPPRQGTRGAYPKPRRRPRSDLLYAQVVKRRECGRVVEVSTRVVFGTPDAVAECLAHSPVSRTVNTSFVERDNLPTAKQSTPDAAHERLLQGSDLVRETTVVVVGLLPFGVTTSELARTGADLRADPRSRVATQVASADTGNGCGDHEPRLDHQRVARVSCACRFH
jgi:IS1 family transposase